jgi:hypothetical protein
MGSMTRLPRTVVSSALASSPDLVGTSPQDRVKHPTRGTAAFQSYDDKLSDQQGVRVSHRSGPGLTGETRVGRIRLRRGERILRGRVDPRAARSTCGCEGREAAPPDEENAMSKYMLIMRGTDESNAAMMASIEEGIARTRLFIEEMMKAGVLLAAEGLDDASQGVVVDFSGEAPVVTDGPYGETKELFGGFFLLDVASKQEAVEWAKRVPAAPGSKIEIRRVPEEDEVPQDSTVQR